MLYLVVLSHVGVNVQATQVSFDHEFVNLLGLQ